jgi:hypothetical protein
MEVSGQFSLGPFISGEGALGTRCMRCWLDPSGEGKISLSLPGIEPRLLSLRIECRFWEIQNRILGSPKREEVTGGRGKLRSHSEKLLNFQGGRNGQGIQIKNACKSECLEGRDYLWNLATDERILKVRGWGSDSSGLG